MFKISTRRAISSALMLGIIVAIGGVFALSQYKSAPDIRFPLLDGRELALSSLVGMPVLVTFWASTCIECRKEMPHLISLYNELSAAGFEIIAVAMPYDPPNRVLETRDSMKLPYAVALDIDSVAVKAFGDVAVTPSTFLIAPDGKIVMRQTGLLDIEQLRRQLIGMLGTGAAVTVSSNLHCNGLPCSG